MRLKLFIQSLQADQRDTLIRSKVLSRLFRRGRHQHLITNMEALLCQQVGLGSESPLAALSMYGELDNHVVDPSAHIFFADPVHLLLQRDSFSLMSPAPLRFSMEESSQLVASLNQHFAADQYCFYAANSGHWYVQMPLAPNIKTHSPSAAIDRDIRAFMPSGPDATKWQQVINEIQMLLFAHPVNQARESRGELPCNSLWLWGGGVYPGRLSAKDYTHLPVVFGEMPLLAGLASLGLCKHSGTLDESMQEDMCWLVLSGTDPSFDTSFARAMAAVQDGSCQTLDCYLVLSDMIVHVEHCKSDTWAFWRRAPDASHYL